MELQSIANIPFSDSLKELTKGNYGKCKMEIEKRLFHKKATITHYHIVQ